MANEIRKPSVGDTVVAIGHKGRFCVLRVDDYSHTADLQVIETGDVLSNAPWMALSYAMPKKEVPEKDSPQHGKKAESGKQAKEHLERAQEHAADARLFAERAAEQAAKLNRHMDASGRRNKPEGKLDLSEIL